MPELTLHVHDDPARLAARFSTVACQPGDPFQRPLLFVPGAGLERWLSQYVARAAGHEGIFAGLDVHPFHSLEEVVSGSAEHSDPWNTNQLVWTILQVIESDDDPALGLLRRHLAANDQRYANARRVAALFNRYADHRPELLELWSRTETQPADPVDAWQPHLWRRLHDLIGVPDPPTRRVALCTRIREGNLAVAWPSVQVFAPRSARARETDLLTALSTRIPVDVWLPVAGPLTSTHPVGAPLGRRARAWEQAWRSVADHVDALPDPTVQGGSALAELRRGIITGAHHPLRPDASISIHASHGPARQVGVLREVLTGVFADDPTLEPRDVVVACPDPTVLAPHLHAAFTSEPAASNASPAHPATTLRLQVAETSAADLNLVYGLVADLVRLGSRRATTNDLLALATHPFVARRFGLDPDDAERLEELLDRAGVRWGINQAHRARFGLDLVAQSTWQLGVQRLILGEAFSADAPMSVGAVATVDDVSSTDSATIGALSELVSRVSRVVAQVSEPAPLSTWVTRLRDAADALVDVPFADTWQLNQFWAALDELDDQGVGSAALLSPADAGALLDGAFAHRRTRPAYGNGSLVVCSLEDLARVPHRVVCLLGLDERTFPRRQVDDGDDLLARAPAPGDPDAGADDRQRILDAVLSASERLIVVYQGFSTHLHAPHHPPSGIRELVEVVGARTETLQPFAPTNFAAPPRSFDTRSLAAAEALTGERRPAPERWTVGFVPTTSDPDEVDLSTLVSLIQHPGRYWLRQRAGLTLGESDPLPDALPLDLGPLDAWAIGHRVLQALCDGQPLEPLMRSEWLSGAVPPLDLGQRSIEQVSATAHQIHRAWEPHAAGTLDAKLLTLDVEGIRVTGTLLTRGGHLVEAHYARISPRHLAAAWVRMLLATAATGNRTDAVLVGRGGHERLVAPPVELAERLLADLTHLAVDGLTEILPMPPRVAHRWATIRARGQDPLADLRGLRQQWKRDEDDVWKRCLPGGPPWDRPRTDEGRWGHPTETTALGALAALVWGPLVKGQGA